MKLKAAFQKARRMVQPGNPDPLRVNAINNPVYSSTVVDEDSGRRSLMGTGRKGACAVMRESKLAPGLPRTVVVLGIARGGTSMVSGVLRGLGIYMGENLGFNHEDAKVQRIVNKQLFDSFGELARGRDEEHALWGFKFPEASLVMDRFHPELRNPHYVFVLRHPMSRGMSVVKRTGGDFSTAITEALESYRAIFTFLDSVDAPVLLVNYEQATESAAECAQQVAGFLGMDASEETIERAAAMIVGEGGGYLNLPEYWFFAEEADPAQGAALTPLAVEPADLKRKEINYAKDRASVWQMPGGTQFPKILRLRFNLAGSVAKSGERIRIYYDYDDRFHLGHRVLLELSSRKPSLRIQTTGQLKRIAIVPLNEDGRIENVSLEAEAEQA